MKPVLQKSLAVVLICTLSTMAHASWFSDLTGVNIDPWHGKFEIGRPEPGKAIQQLPGEIQRLPQTIGNLANPAGLAFAAAIRHAEGQASWGAKPIPATVYQQLLFNYAAPFLQSVRYNTFGAARISLDSAVMMLNNDVAAVTLDDIIVFRNENDAQNPVLWAHELTHVQQYRNMGIDTFANVYTTNAWILENQAIDVQDRVQLVLNGYPQGQQQFAYFNINGGLYYADGTGILYPANPNTGQVIGPVAGRLYFQNGQYYGIDVTGRAWYAMRVQ